MVNLGQKLKGCHTSENIGVIKDVIYKVKQVNRDELQFRVEGLTHWFDFSDVPGVWFNELEILNIPKHYNNDKGTLYKVAQERGWNAYLFDIVKRLERAEKKGVFIEDLDKSIVVIELWKKENNN